MNDILQIILIILFGILLPLCTIGMSIYCYITFGNMPITEIPAWALFFMLGGRK